MGTSLTAAIAAHNRRRRNAGGAAPPGSVVLPDLSWVPGGAAPSGTTNTFTRASNATEIDSGGILQFRTTDVARDSHYIGGVRTALREAQRTNTLLNSNVFTGWSLTAANSLLTANTVTGPDNVAVSASSYREKATTAQHTIWRQLYGGASMTGGVTRLAGKLFVKPTASRTNIKLTFFSAGATVSAWFLLTGAVGTVVSVSDATALPHIKVRGAANGFYEINTVFACQTTGAGGTWQIQPSTDGTTINYLGSTSQGFEMYGAQEEDLSSESDWNACASSYIPTGGSAVSRAPEYWYWTLTTTPTPAPLTMYTKSITQEGGQNPSAAAYLLFGVTSAPAAAHVELIRGPDAAGKAECYFVSAGTPVASLATPTAVFGDTLELRAWLAVDGKPNVAQTLNAGSENVASPGAAEAFPANWQGNRIYFGSYPGQNNVGVIAAFTKLALKDGADQSLATMRAL